MATYKLTADLDGTSSPLQAKSPLTGELLTGKLVAGTAKTYEVLVPNITTPTSSIEMAVDGAVFTTASVDEGKGPALPTVFNATAGTFEVKGKGTVLVSQGRVHKTTAALIRTTEKGVIRQAGVYSFAAWDGKDEDGVAVNQDDYLPMVQVSRVEVRWDKFGNTSDSYTQNVWRGILQPHDVCQAPDGSLVWPVGFNEGKSAIYKTLPGKPNAPIALIAPDYRETICFVVVVGSLVLGAVNSSGHNLRSSTYVRAWRLSDGQSVPFPGGVDATIQQHDQTGIRRGVASLMESPAAADSDFDTKRTNWFKNRITGLAVLGDYLVVARKAQNKLYFLNKNSGALIFTQPVAAPGQLAAHVSGALLVVTAGTVNRYTLVGAQLTQENTLPGIGLAVAVDCHPTQDIIAVADASTDQVLRFKADGTPLASLGQSGGYTNTAVVATDRFCFRYRDKIPGGVPQDRDPDGTPFALLRFLSDGSFYIGSQQLCRVQKFAANLSYLGQVAYISDTLTVAANVNDPTTVFSGLCRYKVSLDEQKPGDQSLAASPTWQLVAYYGGSGTNPDPAKYKNISDAISHTFTGGNGRLYARLNDESLVGQPAMTLEVEVLPNRLRATKNRLPGYGNSNHNFMNQPDGRVIAFARTDTSTAGVFSYAPVARAITGYDSAGDPTRGNATPLMALRAGEIYYRADLTKSSRDPVPEKVTGDGIRIGQTTNGRIWTYQGRMLFDPDPTTKQLTVPRTGTFHLGAVEPGGTTFAVRTHQGKPGDVNTGDGAYPEPTTPAFGGLDGTNFSVLGAFITPYWGGQYASTSNNFSSYYQTGLLAASFGVPIIDPAKYSDDAATAGYAGNALEMVGSIGPNNTQYFYLPDEAEHGAVHRYCLSKTDKVEVFTFPAQGAVPSPAFTQADPTVGRVDLGAMQQTVSLPNTAALKTALLTDYANTILVAADGDFATENFEQKGTWSNVLLVTASGNTRFLATTSSTCIILQGTNARDRIAFRNINLESTFAGGGNPLLWWNELPKIDGFEVSGCSFRSPNGPANGFGCVQYSTSSKQGQVAKNVLIERNKFKDIGRCGIEMLSQGYDGVFRLFNLTIRNNEFDNLGLKNEYGMATSLSGLFKQIDVSNNKATRFRKIAYEFVNSQQAVARDNDATNGTDGAGYGFSDDGKGFTSDIYVSGGTIEAPERPFYIYECNRIHIDAQGKQWKGGRGVQMNTTDGNSFANLNLLIQSTATESGWEWGSGTTNSTATDCTVSSAGSAAAGRTPSFESIVLRSGATGNRLLNIKTILGLRANGTALAGSPATGADGRIVNQGGDSNIITNNTYSTAP